MAEQLPVDPTVWWNGQRTPEGKQLCTYSRVLRNGKKRLTVPGTNTPVKMNGDVIKSVKGAHTWSNGDPFTLKLWWNGSWIPVPTVDEFMEWTIDSVCPTPDGTEVEPDHPDSWLSLVGMV